MVALQATHSYDTLFSLIKGNNLCNQNDISFVQGLHGQMNEANLMAVNTDNFPLVYPNSDMLYSIKILL